MTCNSLSTLATIVAEFGDCRQNGGFYRQIGWICMLNYPNAVQNKIQNVGEFTNCVSLKRGISKSLFPSGCESLRWGISHTGSSSPVISILNVHWCEVQADEILPWDGVYTSLLLPSPDSDVHTVVIFSSLDKSVPPQSWLTYLLTVMQETPTAWRMSSFLFLTLRVIPSIHQSILI